MIYIKLLIRFYLPLICFSIHGQEKGSGLHDSLHGKSYEYFRNKFESEQPDNLFMVYSNAYLQKAKSENNWEELMGAYKIKLHQAEKNHRIAYADSMLIAARRSKQNDLIGSAYLTKGIVYYDLQNMNNALDNYILADESLQNSDDDYLKHKVKYNVAQIKYYLGYFDEAKKLFEENIAYFKDNDDIPYLTSLHSLGLCYLKLGNYDKCTAINDQGIREATQLEYFEAIPRFINSEGINQYFKKNYPVSIAKLNETLPMFIKSRDFTGESATHFYLGKSYLALNQKERAIGYFLKIERAFEEKRYTYPDFREAFEILIDYHKSRGDLQSQLKCIDLLLQADKYLTANFKYLTSRVHKEYDTKKLIREKNDVQHSLKLQKIQNAVFLVVIVVLLAWLAYMIYKARENKRKFRKLLERKAQPKPKTEIDIQDANSLNLNPEVILSVMKHLDKFESSQKFLSKDISLTKLAKICDSNIVYVRKIIVYSRHKKSIDYINDLKIEYILTQLRENSRFRNYTNKALAEEAGFSTTQHFTRAFHKNAGISPTYFVQELKKTMASANLQ